jgi:hypothetical protein
MNCRSGFGQVPIQFRSDFGQVLSKCRSGFGPATVRSRSELIRIGQGPGDERHLSASCRREVARVRVGTASESGVFAFIAFFGTGYFRLWT